MQTKVLTLAFIEITLSILVSVLIIFISFKILQKVFLKSISIKEDNLAFSVFSAGIIISIGVILSEIIPSITNIVRLSMSETNDITLSSIIQYSGLYLFIGFIFALVINASVFLLFSALTKGINEFKEIQQNNVATSIIVTATLLSITLIAKDSISLLISALIPYPETTNFLL
ncbi:DUF350 domain-containing protein [Aquimarina sp. 2201CG5-10]|uniref:DUF350 domain-containing protein n=1 Tax=Aquimarina callyspongiae TaxID=3098150 RepID=UPI002AB40539|nr:DUF350 domain-containing protein [Aquimarina sp. 2201CG5-10]MDY8134976.1 DUF350 domain-containing protein [Aquimarina sp. 2201CG5-10]